MTEKKIEHRISYRSEGEGMTDVRWPVCSCGWEGRRIPAWDDWQYTKNMEEAACHVTNH